MSTTGNEYEQPGVNYPDREDAEGAEATPAADEPQREEAPVQDAPPALGEPHPDANPAPAGAPVQTGEPSHEAIGIGVIDDGAAPGGGAATDAEAAASTDHHGRDEGRDTLTADEAQRAMTGEQEQRLPAMSQNNASDVEKISGILAQTRQDVGHLDRDEVVRVLRQRLDQSGVEAPDDEVEELADQILTGDAR